MTTTEDIVDEIAADPDAPQRRTFAWRQVAILAGGSILVVVLLAAIATFGWLNHKDSQLNAKRAEYVQVARQAALNLTTIHGDTANNDIGRIVEGSSGDLRSEFSEGKDKLAQALKEAKVSSDGTVLEAGLEEVRGGKATVLVAVHMKVRNSEIAEAQDRDFRLRVTVNDNNPMTVSRAELVP